MTALSEPDAIASKESPVNAESRISLANKRALHLILGAQKMMLEEAIFVGNEAFDRALAEIRLFTEFASKTAGAHSVQDIRTLGEQCGQHQIDFVRRDCERILKHAERMIETTSNLLSSRPQN
ncbi:hypothetical protein [Bradyrhizobium canariense]|uniref:Phasin protein n=1 Tax=Bradyrhizobium canariense TaxID=255045 RepID=A0A1H1SXM8_9BRAD|nr:hypothetical protein [Bradyrhizobium canariense]SDS52648.1 hypothetical protein SAMN05444158_2325 [Bradyrhizobium canariense]